MRKPFHSREDYVKFMLPKGAVKVADKQSDAIAYVYNTATGKPCACVFLGKQSEPVQCYQYRSEADREQSVRRCFESRRAHDKAKLERREEDKAFVHDAKVGDIYRTCWGYDQTNVEFFEIVEIKGKFAILREIQCAVDERTLGGPQERIVPQSGKYVDRKPIRRLIQRGGIKIDDVRSASKWGTREPITGTVIGPSVSRTGFGWGH